MSLPDSVLRADFTEKPIATKKRISDGSEMLDVNVTAGYDTTKITYTDGTKSTIAKVEYFLNGELVKTLTPSFGTLTDTWVES